MRDEANKAPAAETGQQNPSPKISEATFDLRAAPSMATEAADLAIRGIPVFPCDPATKKPLVPHGFKEATRDLRTIARWWSHHPNAMIGVPTGAASGFFAVDLDIKPEENIDGDAALAELERVHGKLLKTPSQDTPSGGHHILFKMPADRGVKSTTSKIGPGIDTRGDGGYIVIAPSVRQDGKAYRWDLSIFDTPLAEAPEWLIDKIGAPSEPGDATADIAPGFADGFCGTTGSVAALFMDAPLGAPAELPQAFQRVAGALRAIDNTRLSYQEWVTVTHAVKGATNGSEDFYALVYQPWALTYTQNTPQVVREKWDSIHSPRAGWGALQALASKAGWKDPEQAPEAVFLEELPLPAPEPSVGRDARDPAHGKLPMIALKDIKLSRDNPYLIKGLLDRGALSVLYGDSGTGKTFLALDMALHTATGRPWFGRRVAAGGVLYVAAEAGMSAETRVMAWRKHHGVDVGPFWLIPFPVDLLSGLIDVDRLIDRIRDAQEDADSRGVRVTLVVIDTLSRAFAGGNENSPDDMGRFVRHVDKIRFASGAHVMIVHHCGKDAARGARGHSLLRAAVETELEVSPTRTVTATKQRDMDPTRPIDFGLKVIEVGVDEEGSPITSCVIAPPPAREPFGDNRPEMTQKEQVAFDVLEAAIDAAKEAGREPDRQGDVGLKFREWLTPYAARDGITDPSTLRGSSAESALKRLAEALKSKGWIRKNGKREYVVITVDDES